MSSYLADQIAELRQQIAELKAQQVTYVEAPVTGVDAPGSTFAVTVGGQQDGALLPLSGIAAPPQFLPAPGETVRLAVAGAQPIYQPGGIAENAITSREIAPGSVEPESLGFEIGDLGGTTIFYGPDTPTGQVYGDLWLKELAVDAGVPQYETRRWVPNPDSWQLLADQTATQAVAEAIAAQNTANQAGIDAIAARETADTAAGSALTAQQTAEAAANTAAGKTTTFRQDGQPPTTGRTVGDVWIETDQGNRQHVWTGSAWTLTQLGSAAISATARQLGAITTWRQASAPTTGMVEGDFWIDSDDNKLYRREGSTWTAVQDAAIQTAITNAATAQAVADGKMRIFVQTAAPTDMTAGDVGDMWIDTDDANVTWTWSGTAWVKRQLGNGAIQPQSLVASNVIATGTVTAALLEAVLVLTTTVIAGSPAGEHARLTPSGVMAYAADPVDGVPNEIARLGRTIGVRNATTGVLAAQMDENGGIYGRSLSVDTDPVIGGYPLLGHHIDRLGAGIVARTNDIPVPDGHDAEQGIYEFSFVLKKGRTYGLFSNAVNVAHSMNNGRYAIRVRFTVDGTAPNLSSPTCYYKAGSVYAQAWPWEGDSTEIQAILSNVYGQDRIIRLLLTIMPWGGGFCTIHKEMPFHMWATDEGLLSTAQPNAGRVNNIRGTTGAPPETQPPVRDYVCERLASWSRVWKGDGGLQSTGTAGQGYYPYVGNTRSMIGFPDMTAELAGAVEITRIEVYAYANHWYFDSGGTAIFRTHNQLNAPASFSQNTFPLGFERFYGGKFGGLWSDAPLDWNAGLMNGTIRGITLGPAPNNDQNYYGRFDGSGSAYNKPTIRVHYRR